MTEDGSYLAARERARAALVGATSDEERARLGLDLGKVLHRLHELDASTHALEAALALARGATRLGALEELAIVRATTGQIALAEQAASEAHALSTTLGGDDPLAMALVVEAEISFAKGERARAQPLYEQVLALREARLGPEHPSVAQACSYLAVLHDPMESLGEIADADRALAYARRAHAIRRAAQGDEHGGTALTALALARALAFGDAAPLHRREAHALLRAAIPVLTRSFGVASPFVDAARRELADLLRTEGRHAELEVLLGTRASLPTFATRREPSESRALVAIDPSNAWRLACIGAAHLGLPMRDLACSADGTRLLVVVAGGGTALFDARTLDRLGTYEANRRTETAAFSPDGSLVATGDGGDLQLWHADDGAFAWSRPTEGAYHVAFSPDGSALLVYGEGEVVVRATSDGARRTSMRPSPRGAIERAAWAPDGSRIATVAESEGVALFDARDGRAIWRIAPEGDERFGLGRGLVFARGGEWVAVASAFGIALHDVADGSRVRWIATRAQRGEQNGDLALSPDGRTLFSSSSYPRLLVCDPTTAHRPTLVGSAELPIDRAAPLPCGGVVATTGPDHVLRLWGIAT